MRIFVCGQKMFGAEALRLCTGLGHEIAGVSSPRYASDGVNPDRLKREAARIGALWMEAGKLSASVLPGGVDLIIAAHSHDFIGRATRNKSTLGAIGYHPSLLPLHRGRDSIRWVIYNRERATGGTVYWLNDTVDAGDVAAQDYCFVPPGISPQDLWRELLFPLGLRLIEKCLRDIANGSVVRVKQREELATWEPSWERPPLYRPDLLAIGPMPSGYTVNVEEQACRIGSG